LLRILDSVELIKKIDKSSMLSFCVDASRHYVRAARLGKTVSVRYSEPTNIVVAGMGGSGIGGELLKDWTRDKIKVPIEVCREYSLPAYANKKTLVFIVSYSGETEESLSAFLDALKRKCMTVCVSSGGKLHEIAERLGLPNLRVPSGMAPRAALPYLFVPMPLILEEMGLVSGANAEIPEVGKILKLVSLENSPEKPLSGNFAKMLAARISGTIPVVYGFGIYRAVAQRFKTQFNENSKIPAKWEYFSELNHNDIVGWEEARALTKNFSLIFLRDSDGESDDLQLRIETTQRLTRGKSLKAFQVCSKGKGRMAKMLSILLTGDFTSIYLAILRGIDPTPVKTISVLKAKLVESGLKSRVVSELEKVASN
jgi:glucose/mannose-6-phosphate isomerase